jgi:SAM-dependent methyltransferase
LDAVELRTFYSSRLGRVSRQTIAAALPAAFDVVGGMNLLGFGYANPYLSPYADKGASVITFMPAQQGVSAWPPEGENRAALVHDHQFPLPDSSVERALMVHGIEQCADPNATLKEMWRVLVPGGKICLVVPRRTGLWARIDSTPFGQGRPFSTGQLERALKEAMLTPEYWGRALHFAPFDKRFMLRPSARLEKMGHYLWPAFAGVVILVATKHLYQGLMVKERRRFSPVGNPVLVPSPSSRSRAN